MPDQHQAAGYCRPSSSIGTQGRWRLPISTWLLQVLRASRAAGYLPWSGGRGSHTPG